MPKNILSISVTWNRCQDIHRVIKSVSQQDINKESLDVIIIDNASTDSTLNFLIEQWQPERVVENPTTEAHQPNFQHSTAQANQIKNKAGFRSLTIIHNHHNHGGCGGFNTGFAYIESFFNSSNGLEAPDYIWLIDDDVDLPSDALPLLLEVADSDESIGLVGSRAVDINDRKTTLETTIYFNSKDGSMIDIPPPEHPQYKEHSHWLSTVGGTTRGQQNFTGVIDVDIVSACSMLARWSAVCQIGFWDYRYFIYCDDADWSLRFGKAGYRVVCSMDAVVYHTPWFSKLTPARLYYAQRNLVWMIQKIMPQSHLKHATYKRLGALLKDSLRASIFRRLFHAEIIRRTANDVVSNHGGKLDNEGPLTASVIESLDAIDALNSKATIVVACSHRDAITWAEELRTYINNFIVSNNRIDQPKWTYLIRDDVADVEKIIKPSPENQLPKQITYFRQRWSKLRCQLGLLLHPPTAVVIFNQTNDLPLFGGAYNVHIDSKKPTIAQVEADNIIERLTFLVRWCITALKSLVYSVTVKPYVSPNKYG